MHGCLLHAHAWIRLLAAQLLGLYLGKLSDSCRQQQLAWFRAGGSAGTDETLKSVILDSFEQLNLADSVSAEMSLQVVKNLVALTKLILARGDEKGGTEQEDKVNGLDYSYLFPITFKAHMYPVPSLIRRIMQRFSTSKIFNCHWFNVF